MRHGGLLFRRAAAALLQRTSVHTAARHTQHATIATSNGLRAHAAAGTGRSWSQGSTVVAAALALGATSVAMTMSLHTSECDEATPLQRMQLQQLRDWLEEHGADVTGVEFAAVDVRSAKCAFSTPRHWCKAVRQPVTVITSRVVLEARSCHSRLSAAYAS
jgi:hypothetical protein